MSPTPLDLTVVVNYHREGHLAAVSARSAHLAVGEARKAGFAVDLIAVLDKPDRLTRESVSALEMWDRIVLVDEGDLGQARNAAASEVQSHLLAFMDGDDLCGRSWFAKALSQWRDQPIHGFLHPEYIYYFYEADFLRMSDSVSPSPGTASFFMRQVDTDDPDFDRNALRLNNVFTSNQLGPRDLYLEHPFLAVNHEEGFGVEDWTWNALTISIGIRHAVVKGALHLVRVKSAGSLGQYNAQRRLLPDLRPAFAGLNASSDASAREVFSSLTDRHDMGSG